MESKFVALTEAIKILLWFSSITIECHNKHISLGQQTKPVLYQPLIFIKSPTENYCTKHIGVRLFFVGDLLNKGPSLLNMSKVNPISLIFLQSHTLKWTNTNLLKLLLILKLNFSRYLLNPF